MVKDKGKDVVQTQKYVSIFRKKRINYKQYIKEFYLGEDLSYLFCNVRSIDDVLDPYSVQGYECLNKLLAEHIEQNANFVPLKYPVVLILSGCEFTEEQQRVVQQDLQDFFVLKLGAAQVRLAECYRNAIITFLLGSLFLATCFALKQTSISMLITDAANIIAWFFLLESAGEIWGRHRNAVNDKAQAARLESIHVLFRPMFYGGPASEEEKEQIRNRIG